MKWQSSLLYISLLLSSCFLKAQVQLPDYLGLSGGITCTFGSIVNRVGLTVQSYYVNDFVQINVQARGYYNLTSFGPRPRIPGWEFTGAVGAVIGFGPVMGEDVNPFLSPLSNQTNRRYAIGYAYHCYVDQMKTSQLSGSIAVHIEKFEIASENDAFSGLIDDRFRTGAVKMSYRLDDVTQVGISSLLWTGDTRSDGTFKVRKSAYPAAYGYKDISKGTYGHFSHGILALYAQRSWGYGQVTQLQVGTDSEWVRHVLQNKLIHDLAFVPEKINKARNPHIPMVDTEGMPYLYRKDQRVKPASFFLSGSLNPSLFY